MSVSNDLIEKLADAEHASWARWMDYLFSKCDRGEDGSFVIPTALAFQWLRQVETPYALLSKREKQSDREEVRIIIPFIEAEIAAARMSMRIALGRGRAGDPDDASE